ncbi:MAG: DUF5333 domain-containing protein [Pseudomonadota bacterium]
MIRFVTVFALLLAPLGAPLAARSPGDVAEVRNGLLAVAAGNMIQKNCAEISPRMIRVYTLRNQLIAAARAAGFTDDEIRGFVDDRVARKNYEAEAKVYLEQRGLNMSEPASYCSVGAEEIAGGTAVGRLLRED